MELQTIWSWQPALYLFLGGMGAGAFVMAAVLFLIGAVSVAGLPPLSGFLLTNRLLWLGITAVLFLATVALFKPQRTGTGKRLFGNPGGMLVHAVQRLQGLCGRGGIQLVKGPCHGRQAFVVG